MGPLKGLKVIEIASIGPGPFCAMMLADMGADIIRIDRNATGGRSRFEYLPPKYDVLNRGRHSLALNLKAPEDTEKVFKLVEKADALVEGFRPGVMERLGLGPEPCLQRNPKLVYGRMTGWGQYGPLAKVAGHDINYIALSGALHAIGRSGQTPVPPLNLVGDFGGGGALLAFGIVCALLEARTSGQGQVVDAAMTDGSALLMTMMYGFRAAGQWADAKGVNLLDGGAHFYDTYECADGQWVAIGAIEPQFYALLLAQCGIDDPDFLQQMDRDRWPALKGKLAVIFKTKTRDEWCRIMEGTDVCFAPVLGMAEAPNHPHNRARGAFLEIEGVVQPAPAPRFSRTAPEIKGPPPHPGEGAAAALADWGVKFEE